MTPRSWLRLPRSSATRDRPPVTSSSAQQVREAFVRHYVDDTGRLMGDTQTGYVLALHMGLVGEDLRPVLAAHLVEAIAREEWHLSTGFVGVGYLLPVLSSTGHNDVAYRLLEQRSFPSWLYTVDRGATTIWERWDGWTEERGFQSPAHELVQPLLPWFGRRVVVPVRAGYRAGAGSGRLQPFGPPSVPGRFTDLCPWVVPLGPR